MADQEVVIVDAQGTEHHFPAGFDPKRAADIVKSQSSGVPVARPLENMGSRAPGGYTISDAPEGVVSSTIRGMIHPSPEQQAAQDVLQLAAGVTGGATETAVGAARDAATAGARGVARAAGTVADVVSPEVTGIVSPRLANAQRLAIRLKRAIPSSAEAQFESGMAPRLVKGARPTLTDSLQEALQGAYEQGMQDTLRGAPSPSGGLPGAAPGGAQAGADTMAMLKARGQPTITPTGRAAQDLAARTVPTVRSMPSNARMDELVQKFGGTAPAGGSLAASQEMAQPGAQAFIAREGAANRPLVQAQAAQGAFAGGTGPGGIRTVRDVGGAGATVSPGEAQSAITKAAQSAKMTLTAEETQAARLLVQQGHTPKDVIGAVAAERFKARFGTPSDADVAAEFQQQADSGKKSLVPAYGTKGTE